MSGNFIGFGGSPARFFMVALSARKLQRRVGLVPKSECILGFGEEVNRTY